MAKMEERLESLVARHEEINELMMRNDIVSDRKEMAKWGREQNELLPVVDTYNAYKKACQELEDAKRKEAQRRVLIEQEKARLIKENEDLLKSYYAKGYYKSVSSLENPNSINGSNTQSSYSYTNNSGNTSKAVMGSSYSSNY